MSHWNYPQPTDLGDILPPPAKLIRWVTLLELGIVQTFENEAEFEMRVNSALSRFEERFRRLLEVDCFWDIARKGNKVVERKPKRETDIHNLLHSMLVDMLDLSNIELHREARVNGGAIDFLFSGIGRNGERFEMCVEFKNAHSPDLLSGVNSQLRPYMRQRRTMLGAYCVLDYRGKCFSEPTAPTEHLMGKIYEVDDSCPEGRYHPIKVHWIRLGHLDLTP